MENQVARDWWNNLSEEDKRIMLGNVKLDVVIVHKLIWATSYEIDLCYDYYILRKTYDLGRTDSRMSEREGKYIDGFEDWFNEFNSIE